ncbi:MAG: amidase family protein [Rhodospirillales bacterium]|jgi:amidase|nr:amidase [Rhodospirillaceae bacterium]MDP6430421.1 amidase family protein [Rhodospirillales bacterium]MDP6642696.1 amidase family protein [Rhodospirillales bacterium]MDP6842522.1 amidase family protein [Rhodospirillales bacterium]
MDELIAKTARQIVALLKKGEVTPGQLIDAALARIEAVDAKLNALPTLCAERARQAAENLGGPNADTDAPGWLAGLPIAVKDLSNVAGVRTTFGSPIFADNIPEQSDITVEMLERRGALVIAKSNTPEFGAGANTFNEVFGATLNPWNLALTCGGSSGGSAVALATGQVWLATGSDLGGSLRTPASFCSVVGLRPSPGRVARTAANPYDTLGVSGPMGRDVRDTGLFLDAMAGRHAGDILSLNAPQTPFLAAADTPRLPNKIAFTPDLGCLPVDPEIADICRRAALRLEAEGVQVEEISPDFSDAGETFQTLRAARFAGNHVDLMRSHPDKFKPEIIWNAEKGLALSAEDIAKAETARGALISRVAEFLGHYDLLLCPAAPVPPFDVTIRYVDRIGDVTFDNYIEWIAITYCITLTACPVLSLPCGFTGSGLPVGLQLVAANGEEARLLSQASAMEALFAVSAGLPIEPPIDPGAGDIPA